jgi:predicted RNase H-like HicB family nuclease
MRYAVKLVREDQGFSVFVPGLPGCWSQGETEAEALENIRDAITDYLEVAREMAEEADARFVEVG